jgi:hypothetical protein
MGGNRLDRALDGEAGDGRWRIRERRQILHLNIRRSRALLLARSISAMLDERNAYASGCQRQVVRSASEIVRKTHTHHFTSAYVVTSIMTFLFLRLS